MCFNLKMTRAQALSASHQGPCDEDVEALIKLPKIRRQLRKIPDDELQAELSEYGAWEPEELQDRTENELRITWIAAGNIRDER